jgi:hypothetical protein
MSGDAVDSLIVSVRERASLGGVPRTPKRTEANAVADRVRHYWWLVALLLAWLTWPVQSLSPKAGLDSSWAIALHFAADQGLNFGRDVFFTYGPLGFLSQPLLVTTVTGIAALLAAALLQFGVCAALLRSTLRSYPLGVAILLTYAAMALLAAPAFAFQSDYLAFLAFALVVYALERERRPGPWLVYTGAVLAAVALLVKLNVGIVCALILPLAAWRARPGGWRSGLIFTGVFSASFILLWTAVGSAPGALPAWFHQSFEVLSSYTGAMALTTSSGQYFQALLLAAIAGLLVLARIRALPSQRSLPVAVATAIFWLAYYREGYVRFDAIHATLFFAAIVIGLLAFEWAPDRRWAVAAVIAAALGATAALNDDGGFLFRASDRMGDAIYDIRMVVDPSFRSREVEAARATARDDLGLDTTTQQLLSGHTVDVDPDETSAIWAYRLRWRPHPLIQSYLATDHELDQFNAEALATRGPERILRRQWSSIDGRHPLYTAPESYLVTLCRYRELHAAGRWEVLGRAKNRCGHPRLLDSIVARTGESVAVPRAPGRHDLVFARIRIDNTAEQRLRSVLFRPDGYPTISVDGKQYRLVADVARGPLVLRMPSNAHVAAAFGGTIDYSRLKLGNVASPYRVDFYALRLR